MYIYWVRAGVPPSLKAVSVTDRGIYDTGFPRSRLALPRKKDFWPWRTFIFFCSSGF